MTTPEDRYLREFDDPDGDPEAAQARLLELEE